MSKQIAVTYLKNHAPYKAGDIAGCDEDKVEKLAAAGIVKEGAHKVEVTPVEEVEKKEDKAEVTKEVKEAPKSKAMGKNK